MQLSDFSKAYPRLFAKLVDHRAHALSLTPTYLKSQERALINSANIQLSQMHLDAPSVKRASEFYDQVPLNVIKHELKTTENAEVYLQLEKIVLDAQVELARLEKLLPIPPSASSYAKAREQVENYLTLYFKHGAIALENIPMSAVERYQLSQLFWKGKNRSKLDIDWAYFVTGNDSYDTLAEPTIESFEIDSKPVGWITRNSYGVLCLNTPDVMFVDIDFDFEAPDIACGSLPWGRGEAPKPGEKLFKHIAGGNIYWGRQQAEEHEIVENIYAVARDTGLVFDCYRTCNGFRLIEMTSLWNASSYESGAILERLGSDRLYQRLCVAQNCYRSRLMPKPWRSGNAVCRFVETIHEGSKIDGFKLTPPLNQEAMFIKQLHDQYCINPDYDDADDICLA